MFDQCRRDLCSGNEKAAVANNPIEWLFDSQHPGLAILINT